MWVYENNLNYTCFLRINNENVLHTITECYRSDIIFRSGSILTLRFILFEYNGAYYIHEPNQNTLGFKNEATVYINEVSSEITHYYRNGQWLKGDIDKKFVFLEETIWESGYYLIDEENKKAIPQVESWSDPMPSIDWSFEGESLYKSNSLFGLYEWQGEGTKEDILVGWRKYSHVELDNEGVETGGDVIIIESVQLFRDGSTWLYTYRGIEYKYNSVGLESTFIMEADNGDTLEMTFDSYTSLTKDTYKFGGGAQVVH